MAHTAPLRQIWKSDPFTLDDLPAAAAQLTRELGEVFGTESGALPRGVVALQGEMGAGKTTLVQALCQSWGVVDSAVSPTFGLVQCYQRGKERVFHLDLYRLRDESEAWDLGLTEYFDADALSFVEWPEQAPGLLPTDSVLLQVQVLGMQHEGMRQLILSTPVQKHAVM